jgi:malonyl-CoA/methylmalonyl-CoA synthetase
MHEKFDPGRVWETLESERCTLFMAVPTIYQRLMNQWDVMKTRPNLQSMRLFISGSAPLLENQFDRFERQTGFRVLERYGMTESGMITSNLLDPAGRIATSVGHPLPGVEIRVMKQDGTDADPGEVGEVYIRGENVFKGYWRMPEKTRETFDGNWLKSGDLGYLDSEDPGRLFLVGRAKELIITGGYNVYPKEIENLLDSHEAVMESAVIGLPDEDFGERVTAVVALNQGNETDGPEALIQYCKKHLVGYKCPKQVIVTDRLPRNAMGKLQKNQLLEQYSQEAK